MWALIRTLSSTILKRKKLYDPVSLERSISIYIPKNDDFIHLRRQTMHYNLTLRRAAVKNP